MYQMRKAPHMIRGLEDLIAWADLPAEAVVVEIGSYRGESTEVWAKRFAHVTAVDPWLFPDPPKSFRGFVELANKTFGKVEPGSDRASDIDWANMSSVFSRVEQSFDRRMAEFDVQTLKMTGVEAADRFDDATVDMVYIDANHDYDAVVADLRAWRPKVKPGGVLAGHNYDAQWPDVVRAVDELTGGPEQTFQDTSWAVRLTP